MSNGIPGRLTGGGIRRVPDDKIDQMLAGMKLRTGKGARVKSVRYRVTGFRGPHGEWIARDPRNGHYYRMAKGRRRTRVKPAPATIAKSESLSIEVEIDRGKGPRLYYTGLSR